MAETEFVIEPGRHDIVMTRIFDAPREIVFKAMTDPSLIPNWWGPAAYPTRVEAGDFRTGGSWRFVSTMEDGTDMVFWGVFHEVTAPERIVQTFEYQGAGHAVLETATLEEVGGRTRYVAVSVFPSVADRDTMVGHGMQSGASETMDRLATLLGTLR